MPPTLTQNQNNPFVNFVTDLVKKTKGSVSDIVNSIAKSGSVPNYLSDVAIKNVVKPIYQSAKANFDAISGQQPGETTQQYNERQMRGQEGTFALSTMAAIPGPNGIIGPSPEGEVATPVESKVAPTIPKTEIPTTLEVKPPVKEIPKVAEQVNNLPVIDNRPTIDSPILDKNGVPFKTPVNQYATPDANPLTGKDVSGSTGLPPIEEKPPSNTVPITGKIHSEIPDNPVDVSGTRVNKNPVTQGNPVIVDLRNEAKRNPYYLEDMQNSQKIIDQYVPGNTAKEVEANLNPKILEESKRIDNVMATQAPKTKVTLGDIIDANETTLKEKGLNPISENVNPESTATNQLITQFNNIKGGKKMLLSTEITGPELREYISNVDKQLQNVYKIQERGGSLTPPQTAMLTMRRTLSEQLKTMYPDISDALDRQSGMITARPSVANAAGAEETATIKTANAPKPNAWQRFKNQSLPAVGLELGGAGVAAGGLYAGSQAIAGGAFDKQTSTTSTDTSKLPDRYTFKDPIKSGLVVGPQDQANQLAALDKKIGEDKKLSLTSLQGDQQLAIDTAQQAALQKKFDAQTPVLDQWKKTYTIQLGVNKAVKLTNNAPPNPAQFIKWYDDVRKGKDKQYSQLTGVLNWLEKNRGADFSKVKTKDALLGALDSEMENVKSEQDAAEEQYTGGSQQTLTPPSNLPIIKPQVQPSNLPTIGTPSHLNFNFGSAGQGLPAIQ
jgi:hypothetical protein